MGKYHQAAASRDSAPTTCVGFVLAAPCCVLPLFQTTSHCERLNTRIGAFERASGAAAVAAFVLFVACCSGAPAASLCLVLMLFPRLCWTFLGACQGHDTQRSVHIEQFCSH